MSKTEANQNQTRHHTPKVAVLILNCNGLKWLKICLPSVIAWTYPNLLVYVVDNGSTDGSLRYVTTMFPRIKLIAFKRNLGFAEAYNRAIFQLKAEYVLLLNNDTSTVTTAWLGLMVQHLDQDPKVAAVGCKLVTMTDHSILDSVGVMGIRYWRGFVDIGKNEGDQGQYDSPPIIPFSPCGAAMLLRRTTFLQVNGFDPKFFMYSEDVDLSWRLRLLGFKIVYEPGAKVAHYYSGTRPTKGVDKEKLYLSNRNLLRAIIKNCGSSTLWALRTYLLFTAMLTIGFAAIEPLKTIALIRAVLWNLLNLKDSYARRLTIQRTRIVEDGTIVRVMYPNVARYLPAEHIHLRELLDLLFSGSVAARSHMDPLPN